MDSAIAASLIAARPASASPQVIDYEHQTLLKEKNGQPAPAAGWFKGLEYRPGQGLFMTGVDWTDRARSMIVAGEYRYLSPVFSFDPNSGAVKVLHSVALTNTPALTGLTDLAAASTMNPGATLSQTMAINEEDRARLKHVFGDIFDVDAAIGRTPTEFPDDQKVDLSQVSAEDFAKLKHVFGDLPGLSSIFG